MARSVLQRVLSRLRPPPSIATTEELGAFLQERASFIAQKCAIDYCRGKTGLVSYALFSENTFLDALDICRWEAFAAVLGDLFILADSHLQAHARGEQRARLREALVALHDGILGRMAAPAHRREGWQDALASFALRIGGITPGEAPGALDVADHSAKRLFDTLPIHSSYRELDEEVVYGAVRFRMIALNQELQRRLDPAQLLPRLLG